MMKKTKRKHLLRTIKKNAVTFFAVAFIAAVSIAIFVGFQSASQAILQETDRYFNDNNLQTLEIACANGITLEDLEAISSWEGVTAVEGGYTTSVRMRLETERIQLQARTLLSGMNQPRVLKGVLPSEADEIAIEELLAKRRGLKVGDVITLEHDGELLHDTFTITAVINEPSYCCVNVKDARGKGSVGLGSNDFYIELRKDAFDPDYFSDCYTTAYVDCSTLDGIFYFSDEYYDSEAAYIDRLDVPAQERATLRYESLVAEVQGKIDDAQAELDDAQLEISDAETEIANAEAEIEQAKIDITDGEQELADGKQALSDSEQELSDALTALEAQLTELSLPTDLDDALTAVQTLGPAGEPLRSAILEYRAGEEAINDAKLDLATAEQELADAKAELAEGEQELADAKAELADGKAEFADAQLELDDAKADASEIREEKWVVSGRNDMGDVRGVQTIVDMLTGLSYAMSVIFLIVSTVICYASATKMISEQKTLIGAQKALGLKSGEIMQHFMIYNVVCGLLGIVLGWVLGVLIVESLVLFVFNVEFLLGSIRLTFALGSALIAAAIAMVIFVVATYATCAKLSKQPAITLMRGEEPGYGKARFFESWGVYKRLSLYSKTMIKNVLIDKGRMFTTIMGVVGCVALLVSCMTMKMGIENSSIRHFEDYFYYSHRLVVDTDAGDPADFQAVLEQQGVEYTLIHDKLENFRVNGGPWENSHMIAVSDQDAIGAFMRLEDVSTGNLTTVPEDGVLVSRRAAERFDLSEGSVIEFMDEKGKAIEFRVAGVMEHYLTYHLFVTSESYYTETMGTETDNCVFLLKGDLTGLLDKVVDLAGFLSMADNSAFAANADVHSLVIAICTALSAALALLVLLNQITMHINRKARELAVMRINGYTMKETKAYIYKDNIVLTVLGLIFGCAAGIALGYLNIRIIETGACRYVRDPNLIACAISCGIVAVFAFIVNLIALRRVKQLNLTNVSSN